MKIFTNRKGAMAIYIRRILLIILVLRATPLYPLVIKGDVYGGGKVGQVGEETAPVATNVNILSGEIRTVYGGGQNGKVYGATSVAVAGGVIGSERWEGTLYGGVYGGGEGNAAVVYGTATVEIGEGRIYNNVYGGGRQANLIGNTNLHIDGGEILGALYAGARMADIEGRTYLWVEGNQTNSLYIGAVYGGNDISGSINLNASVVDKPYNSIPVTDIDANWMNWNSFVRVTSNGSSYPVIGEMYGGGNGDYIYEEIGGDLHVRLKEYDTDSNLVNISIPVSNIPTLPRALLDIQGGTFGQIYGGGNSATVTASTDIYLNHSHTLSPATISAELFDRIKFGGKEGVDYQVSEDGLSYSMLSHIGRLFGGNNKVAMDIRPTWHLLSGKIGTIYSGGNRGDMRHPNGIMLVVESNDIYVDNLYGGCRMADVNPGAVAPDEETIVTPIRGESKRFAKGYGARVYLSGGKIGNVYGGNDISGNVYYGTNVEIHTSISGNIYGAGNGSYAYTDNAAWVAEHPEDADYYYEPGGLSSSQAMFLHRPHIDRTLLHIYGNISDSGTPIGEPLYVLGGVYCGGNSATLYAEGGADDISAELRIGKNVVINSLYLGSNGEELVRDALLEQYRRVESGVSYSSVDLTQAAEFSTYMRSVALDIMPKVTWDWANNLSADQTRAYIGSFYCGGNVGSITYSKPINILLPSALTIYNKVVGGSNNADVVETVNNASYSGGIIVANAPQESLPKLTLRVRSVLEPRKLVATVQNGFIGGAQLTWNMDGVVYNSDKSVLYGANIYGGCYESGHVDGDVQIDIEDNLISPNIEIDGKYLISGTTTPVGEYIFSNALSLYGGGYGNRTEIWGNVTINLSKQARLFKIYGGGERGSVIGNTYINLSDNLQQPIGESHYNAFKVYGGGMEGDIVGRTNVKVLGGKFYDLFGGSCFADIDGTATVIIGDNSLIGDENNILISHNVYGGNDFGGSIVGTANFGRLAYGNKFVKGQTMVAYYSGIVKGNIFGGANGAYDYDIEFSAKRPSSNQYPTLKSVITNDGNSNIYPTNTFVYVASPSVRVDRIEGSIFGGGRGYSGATGLVDVDKTYIHLASTGTYATRVANGEGAIVGNVYGGAYYSFVNSTNIDAVSGYYDNIFGGTYGLSHTLLPTSISYDCNSTLINLYGMNNRDLNVYGAGSLSGAERTEINLYAGNIGYVYGGSLSEGYCKDTYLNVPDGSTFVGKALYGGAVGSADNLPCDVENSHITVNSSTVYLSDGYIFGGNRDYRATKITNIVIDKELRSSATGPYITIFGAGHGEHTITGYANVTLLDGARVQSIYGGALEGKVYNRYNNKAGAVEYFTANSDKYVHWSYADPEENVANRNTNIILRRGSRVLGNIYGGGLGESANVMGSTGIRLVGGIVDGDTYGGGSMGDMQPLTATDIGVVAADFIEVADEKVMAIVEIIGGKARSLFGGGEFADVYGRTKLSIGLRREVVGGAYSQMVLQEDGESLSEATIDWGKPVVMRSAYGGGENGHVTESGVYMNNGYVGYDYDYSTSQYTPNIKINSQDIKNLLKENGNLYGGGYGEGAWTKNSNVVMYGGTVRNSLYGGGEIASIGRATMSNGTGADRAVDWSQPYTEGTTNVVMYGGLVENNVFGGGRGFSYTLEGALELGSKLYTDGYVFGSTNVTVSCGTIGTDASLLEGAGNVFGGGNIGYVFSIQGKKNGYSGEYSTGYYYKSSGEMSEDCRVEVIPACIALATLNIGGTSFQPGDIIPIEQLDMLEAADTRWNSIDKQGIEIRNAVFAGGNVTQGSDLVYADVKTIFGNVTASVVDLFNVDLITISAEGVGGLYGDGNLTLVDGYRELNITNYGTDYYNLNPEISYDDYELMHPRQKAYYELKYTCLEDHRYIDAEGRNFYYYKDNQISGAVYSKMPDEERQRWKLAGFATLYAGRMINTVQRTDLCGVWGSRIVLKGARDRGTSIADFTNYTLNRVGELSLNETESTSGETHGCYFGIYNVVNLLGAMSSSRDFYNDVRLTDNQEDVYAPTFPGQTYQQWKESKVGTRYCNNGTSPNVVALASGVFLEIVESRDESGEKIYGPVTGVVELDLINVAQGEGGGYVYAKNIHGRCQESNMQNVTLSRRNLGAASYKRYIYIESDDKDYATSGNFIHSKKQIVDDCFPRNGDHTSQAHYWYIRGDFYVYEQTISAYTGTPQAYSETVDIPIGITAGANGKLKLLSVSDGYYAYLDGKVFGGKQLTSADSIYLSGRYYKTNSPISDWDFNRLSDAEQELFVKLTYVCQSDVENFEGLLIDVDGNSLAPYNYKRGDVILPSRLAELEATGIRVEVYDEEAGNSDATKEILLSEFFRPTNAMNSAHGYMLTFGFSNPYVWSDYYTKILGTPNQVNAKDYNLLPGIDKTKYMSAPTYHCNVGGIYGQYEYKVGDVVPLSVKIGNDNLVADAATAGVALPDGQAIFEEAYVAKENLHIKSLTNLGTLIDLYITEGNLISATDYHLPSNSSVSGLFEKAYRCEQTFLYSGNGGEVQYFYGDMIPASTYNEMALIDTDAAKHFAEIFLCTQSGRYGGALFVEGQNYLALQYCSLSAAERENFSYNKDAFDLLGQNFPDENSLHLYDPLQEYDPYNNGYRYSGEVNIDYTAVYRGSTPIDLAPYGAKSIDDETILTLNGVMANTEYEKLPNERKHYAKAQVEASGVSHTYYAVHTRFMVGDSYYNQGVVLIDTLYNDLAPAGVLDEYVYEYRFGEPGSYYICVEDYTTTNRLSTLQQLASGVYTLSNLGTEILEQQNVTRGTVIDDATFKNSVLNLQANFNIVGVMPTETSTLYVSREADIRELSQDKIISVVYLYSYLESDMEGNNLEEIIERHIINIRVHFESGVPKVGELQTPQPVMPGQAVGINTPSVEPGAYEIMGGGFEIFSSEADAFAHKNGVPYEQARAPLYWYQNDYWLAYYARTYLGKTYSNPVRLTVANYHRLEDVINDPEHLHIDSIYDTHSGAMAMVRIPKIYIDNHICADATKNELDLLSDLYNDYLINDDRAFTRLNGQIDNGANLHFVLQSDVEPKAYAEQWRRIGSETECFEGNLHGNGYTISALSSSLFGNLCGTVYNLGVTGSFTGAGVSDKGGTVINSWVYTDGLTTSSPIIADGGVVINSYYRDSQYSHSREGATPMTERDFMDGTVAYNLNGYYLQKRKDIADGTRRDGSRGIYLDYNGVDLPVIKRHCTTSAAGLFPTDYVERYYMDGDFLYSNGRYDYNVEEIRRVESENVEESGYFPIYPDDYIYFGQNLSYGYIQNKEHNSLPSHINRSEEIFTYFSDPALQHQMVENRVMLISTNTLSDNRVYRAPAYRVSSPTTLKQGVYFNRDAVFVAKYLRPDSTLVDIDPELTAIDLTGYGDLAVPSTALFGPWLDYGGIRSIHTDGITRNLLIYADRADTESYTILREQTHEPQLSLVAPYNTVQNVSSEFYPQFHLVECDDSNNFVASENQFLVDKENFVVPIEYSFADGAYMWYQRKPAAFANGTGHDGWEGLVLPFTADVVTTQQKGEITHFYNENQIGHEYWLRGFVGVDNVDGVKAKFARPTSLTEAVGYDARYEVAGITVNNTYLYDYYYSKSGGIDANRDNYFASYYASARSYQDYVLTTASVPYIVAYPGERYYEFDMSGHFEAENTALPKPQTLNAQTVTYISKDNQVIERYSPANLVTNISNYSLRGTFADRVDVPNGTSIYKIDDHGAGFTLLTESAELVPFRSYLTLSSSSSVGTRGTIDNYIPIADGAEGGSKKESMSGIEVYVKDMTIYIESYMQTDVRVNIYSASGQLIDVRVVSPGERVTVPVHYRGVYIVNREKVVI